MSARCRAIARLRIRPSEDNSKRCQNERSVLRMIAAVGPGVIFLNVNRGMADGSDRAPVQPSEVHD